MSKNEIREKYKEIREKIDNKEELSARIADRVISSSEYINAKTICAYISFGSEVNTSKIIENALKNNKVVGVPAIYEGNMEFYKIDSIEELQIENSFGIKEPKRVRTNFIENKAIDLVIVPGICFDLENNRIGFGKGYYDKYLSNRELNAIKMGICFEEQILKHTLIETNAYDVKMDKIVY